VTSEGGSVGNVVVRDNLFWDLAAGAIEAGDGTTAILHNTIFDYGKGGGTTDPFGIAGGGEATIENNIIYAANGTAPYSGQSTFVAKKNLCSTGCDVAWKEGTFQSSDPNATDFLKLAPASPAIDAGGDVGVARDYFGTCRPQGAGFDLGAAEAL
jgi:hypothetical protein